jgi:hypothetical protein
MPLGSAVAKNAALDACYGASRSTVWPATLYAALYNGDPRSGGVELTSSGGYARVAYSNNGTNFGAASGGAKTNLTDIVWPTSTAAYSATATWFAFLDNSAGGNLMEVGALSPTLTVSGASQVPKILASTLSITQL